MRTVVRDVAQKAGSQRLDAVPVLTVELPAAFSPELVAAVDAVGAVIQPFFTGAIDTSKKRCGGPCLHWCMICNALYVGVHALRGSHRLFCCLSQGSSIANMHNTQLSRLCSAAAAA